LAVLLAILAAALAALAFVALAGVVMEGEALAPDRRILLALRSPSDLARPIGPSWLPEAARDVTGLGSYAVLGLATFSVTGFLLLVRKRAAAALVAASVAGGVLLSALLKLAFQRPRPDLVPHAVEVFTASFPSQHATLSAVVYLTLGALLMRVQPNWPVKLYVMAVAVAVALLVGASRVYLGVHWPTDVLAGWCLGAAWARACWLAALWLQRRGAVEPSDDPQPP
jgi:undecaprenyl-diphosphatase